MFKGFDIVHLIRKRKEASTQKSAKTHASTVFVTHDLDRLTPK